jgi:hypothetical protein
LKTVKDASPVDAAVIRQTFRAALAEAGNTQDDGLQPMFENAVKFGDNVVQRAVQISLLERSRIASSRRRGRTRLGLATPSTRWPR